ncbi:MAG: bis(5'-nucleosyl)-tetraphosphatase (symmetrical) YqeK [Eubacteriales bacterium]|nr:bis(5'-nucleosyl)-tetraphosphatase (symmetrical) YqeK [Eubacteriales bacterium]
MNTDSIEKYIKKNFQAKRRNHTYGVRDTAISLAKRYGADPEKARVAALYHDMVRRASNEMIDDYIENHGLDPKYKGNANLAHGPIAAIKMKEEYGIDDEDILNAVRYHTTGRAGMSVLEKVVFLADAIEPNRSYPGVQALREAALQDLDRACMLCLEHTVQYVKSKGEVLDDQSLAAYNYFKDRQNI